MATNDVVKVNETRTETPVHYIPKVDMWEDDEAVHMKAVMPGVRSEDVEITLEGNKLRIYGRSVSESPEGMKLIYSEYEDGDYERIFTLSERIDHEKIEARVEDGILRLDFAKAEAAKPMRIPVKTA